MTTEPSVKDEKNPSGFLVGKRFFDSKNLIDQPAQGQLKPVASVEKIITEQLGSTLAEPATIRFGDDQYYLPTEDEIDFILLESKLDRKRFMQERFDCDDFSFILKGEISAHAYKAGQLTCGICAGIAWGYFKWNQRGYHAVNWYLGSDESLKFIEPQWDVIFPVEQGSHGIDLFLA